ncbi:MAG: phenylacetate--CoA ligase family protein [Deltaproteobacteria bacterium]|nr:MAG: phenylacetate--CoA ligase family protein [Deltaproteobacteria bacterium]
MIDLYGPLLAKALFPAFEAARGRPTVGLLRSLRETERWTPGALRDLQVGLLRRLLRHAYRHTAFYRQVLDERNLSPEDFTAIEDLARLPLLERPIVRASIDARTARVPPLPVITKTTSGSSGEPVTVRYNAESRHWRDAIRWRGYGWGGYRIGMRALHYWGMAPPPASWWKRKKVEVDRLVKRDLYVDSTPRGDDALAGAVAQIRKFRPQVIVAYANGAGALARYVNDRGVRDWDAIPVLTGAERLLPHDRTAIEQAFGPAFDTYGCREVMLIGSECEVHDGMHTSMENLIVELVVREPDGAVRAARPGESGEVVVTDLHNLACPMIRYVTGDLAVARGDARCACGRGLVRIGPIEGRVTETLVDAQGRAVSGLVFNIVLAIVGDVTRAFQVVQRLDRSIVFKVVPFHGDSLPERETRILREHAERYLPGVPLAIEVVPEIPLTAAGKLRPVVVERPA